LPQKRDKFYLKIPAVQALCWMIKMFETEK